MKHMCFINHMIKTNSYMYSSQLLYCYQRHGFNRVDASMYMYWNLQVLWKKHARQKHYSCWLSLILTRAKQLQVDVYMNKFSLQFLLHKYVLFLHSLNTIRAHIITNWTFKPLPYRCMLHDAYSPSLHDLPLRPLKLYWMRQQPNSISANFNLKPSFVSNRETIALQLEMN